MLTVGELIYRSIDEDNLGYGMLKGMGWALGQGLGADQSGIAQPINDGGQTAFDKGGVGSRGSVSAVMRTRLKEVKSPSCTPLLMKALQVDTCALSSKSLQVLTLIFHYA